MDTDQIGGKLGEAKLYKKHLLFIQGFLIDL